jgi:hypothetical protein
MQGLRGRRVILTDGASGIGRATAIRLDDAAYITGQTISVSGGLTMHG